MQQRVQVLGDRRACLLDRARIAPPQTSPIEPAGARELGDASLKK